MSTKQNLSRMTIDIPAEDHKRLKALAAVLGKSMREIHCRVDSHASIQSKYA